MGASSKLQRKFASVWALLDERTRRLMAASEAQTLGYGGISEVRRACGLSRMDLPGHVIVSFDLLLD